MAIQSYEHFLQQTEDQDIRQKLQQIQQEHKFHAIRIAEQIQSLGGRPVNDPPMMAELMLGLKSLHKKDLDSVIKDAYVGEKRGIDKVEEIIKGDLDPDSRELISEILQEDKTHLMLLNNLISAADKQTE